MQDKIAYIRELDKCKRRSAKTTKDRTLAARSCQDDGSKRTNNPNSSVVPSSDSPVDRPGSPLCGNSSSSTNNGSVGSEERVDERCQVNSGSNHQEVSDDVGGRPQGRSFEAMGRDSTEEILDGKGRLHAMRARCDGKQKNAGEGKKSKNTCQLAIQER